MNSSVLAVSPWRRFFVLSVALSLLWAAPWPASARDTPLLLVLQKKANALGLYDPQSGAHLWNVEVGAKPHEMALSEGDRLAEIGRASCRERV